jgi:hypothetical protein
MMPSRRLRERSDSASQNRTPSGTSSDDAPCRILTVKQAKNQHDLPQEADLQPGKIVARGAEKEDKAAA